MLDKLKQLGDLKKMRSQAMAIQKQMAAEKVEYESDGVRVIASGDQKILALETGEADDETIVKVINKALKKSQKVAARKLAASGDLGGLGGLLGQ